MSLINSKHNLGGFDKDQSPNAEAGRSDYCYLFKDAANDPDAGRFTALSAYDKKDEETIRRLLYFATWIERSNSAHPVDDFHLRIKLPAAFTYFGQFLNHDLSAPVGSMLGIVDEIPETVIIGQDPLPGIAKMWRAGHTDEILLHIRNQQAKPLTLDSLYSDGPFRADGQKTAPEVHALYDAQGLHFVLYPTCAPSAETLANAKNPIEQVKGAKDLPRGIENDKRVTLIADRRNDGNLILAQLHLAFMLFHNTVVDILRPEFPDAAACFAAARRLVTRHYHWCILHDFLPRILSHGAVKAATDSPQLFDHDTKGKVPMEFTTAAFRFGHSLISGRYDYNSNFGTGKSIDDKATLIDLFAFTSAGGMKGYDQLPNHWVIDWNRMTADVPANVQPGINQSEQIDTRFAQGLMSVVPDAPTPEFQSIVARNLVRGFHRRMPFGQVLAKLCNKPVLSHEDICAAMPNGLAEEAAYPDADGDQDRRSEFASNTPAWLYFLCEAKLIEGGERLGPTASQIIAETFVTLMGLQNGAIAGEDGRAWHPSQSPLKTADDQPIATLRDLLRYATPPPQAAV